MRALERAFLMSVAASSIPALIVEITVIPIPTKAAVRTTQSTVTAPDSSLENSLFFFRSRILTRFIS